MLDELRRWTNHARTRGPRWLLLYGAYRLASRLARRLDRAVIETEQARFMVGPDTLTSARHTRADNVRLWNAYDWSQGGEEWTAHAAAWGHDPAEWKRALIAEVMRPNVRGTILEVGPGAGRWSSELLGLAAELHLADVAETCLDACRAKFGGRASYHLIDDGSLSFLPDGSVDSIWAYDVFVHVNPTETARYLDEMARVLRPGGRGVVHHGDGFRRRDRERSYRSYVTADFFAHRVEQSGMRMLQQDLVHPHRKGDCISVFERP
jgi:SAM-dependent methyltransferase